MIDPSKYKKMFIDETMEHISLVNDTVPGFEKDVHNIEAINVLFRSFHSIKGMAASMSYSHIQELSHKLEDLLDSLRQGTAYDSEDVINILYDGTELIEKMVRLIEEDSEEIPDSAALLKSISNLMAQNSGETGTDDQGMSRDNTDLSGPLSEAPENNNVVISGEGDISEEEKSFRNHYKIEVTISEECVSAAARAYILTGMLVESGTIIESVPPMSDIEEGRVERELKIDFGTDLSTDDMDTLIGSVVEIEKYVITEIEPKEGRRTEDVRTPCLVAREKVPDEKILRYRKPGAVKVDTPVLDNLINIVGEMFIQENRLIEITRNNRMPETLETVNLIQKLIKRLYKEVMTLRLVPISLLTDMAPRIKREVLQGSEKKVNIEITGKEIKLDRSIVEKLGDPFMHLLRNSIDHGVESPEERIKAGKSEEGSIIIKTTREKDMISIDFTDDGKGLDRDIIKNKAVSCGLISAEEAELLEDDEIHSFIWHPGFSTAGEVTSLSGRGVGMDVVKNVVEELGGKIWVDSTKGQGCSFHMEIPMTIAIIRTFRIKLNDDIFAFPLNKIVRTIEIKDDELIKNEDGMHFFYRDEKINVYDLKDILQYSSNGVKSKESVAILIVESGRESLGVIVDSFIAGYETVVKPLGKPLERLEILSGTTVSEKGELILILDVDKIIARALASSNQFLGKTGFISLSSKE